MRWTGVIGGHLLSGGSDGQRMLAGTASRPLAGDDPTGVEELAAGHVLEHERVVRRERERGVQRGEGGVPWGGEALFVGGGGVASECAA